MRAVVVMIVVVLGLPVVSVAQTLDVRAGPGGMSVRVDDGRPGAVVAIPAESYRLEFEPNPDGASVMKVVAPEGALLQVWEGQRRVHEEDIPTSFTAKADVFYRFVIKLADGRTWEKKLAAKRRQTGTLALLVPAPQVVVVQDDRRDRHDERDRDRDRDRDRHDRDRRDRDRHDEHRHDHRPPPPMALPDPDFAALRSAIEAEGFEAQKLGVLQTALPTSLFTVAQVGALVDLFDFSSGKVKVVELCKPRIVDSQNAFQLYGHFSFESDKAKVRAILAR